MTRGKKRQNEEEEERQREQYKNQLQHEISKLIPNFGTRQSFTSQTILIERANLNVYIETILRCLDELLNKLGKKVVPLVNPDGSKTFYITSLSTNELMEYRIHFAEYTTHSEALPEKDKFRPEIVTKINELNQLGIVPEQIFIGWVNGEEGGDPLIGTISLLYGMLKLKLENPNIMFGSLDDDSDKKTSYLIFEFKHLNEEEKNEASADLTNIVKIIDNVTNLISSKYPDTNIVSCFNQAKENFIENQPSRTIGGKRRKTKRRKIKRRKTKRRRKY